MTGMMVSVFELICRLLVRLSAHGPPALVAGIVIGLSLPFLADVFRPTLPFNVFAMLTLLLARVDVAEALGHIRRPLVLIAALIALMVIAPLMVAGLLSVFGHLVPAGVALGLIIYAASPPIVSFAAISGMLKLNATLALVLIMVATVLTPATLPFLTDWLGYDSGISPTALATRLTVIVGSASFGARMLRKAAGRARLARRAGAIDGLVLLLVVQFAIAAMDGLPARFMAEPLYILSLLALSFFVTLSFMGLTLAAFRLAGADRARTLALGAGLRNMALGVASIGTAIDPDTWIYFAVAQFPIYLLPFAFERLSRRRR